MPDLVHISVGPNTTDKLDTGIKLTSENWATLSTEIENCNNQLQSVQIQTKR